jgi:hypothetical protein
MPEVRLKPGFAKDVCLLETLVTGLKLEKHAIEGRINSNKKFFLQALHHHLFKAKNVILQWRR